MLLFCHELGTLGSGWPGRLKRETAGDWRGLGRQETALVSAYPILILSVRSGVDCLLPRPWFHNPKDKDGGKPQSHWGFHSFSQHELPVKVGGELRRRGVWVGGGL